MMSLSLLTFAAIACQAQTGQSDPAFDVASIRSGAIARTRVNVVIDPGRVNYRAHTLRQLIQRAYGLEADQVRGPDWTASAL
jgi:uncharacterized protein (TIGR03435 family)